MRKLGHASLLSLLVLAGCEAPARLVPEDADAGVRASCEHTGLGTKVTSEGVQFGLWAPHAAHVFVAGEWSGFDEEAHELVVDAKSDAFFCREVRGARAGQRYYYVIRNKDQTFSRVDPRARALAEGYESVIVDPSAFVWSTSAAFQPAPLNEQVLYELHVGAFTPEGTLRGAAAKLDHLAGLGINMIELLPPAEFPGNRSSGYNPDIPFAVESSYGTPDDLRYFVDQAHARHIGVVIDVVHGHYARKTPLWCYDGECPKPDEGGIYFYPDTRLRDTPLGPRPDYTRSRVRNYIIDNAVMWLTEYRADGIRWDETSRMRMADGMEIPEGWTLLRDINQQLLSLKLHRLQIAQDLGMDSAITRAIESGGAGFTTQWDGSFAHTIDAAVSVPSDAERNMGLVRDAIVHLFNGRTTDRVIYTESHDEVAQAVGKKRLPETISPGAPDSLAARLRSTLGAAIALTAPGIPMLFMGQELLESGSFDEKTPLDWSKATRYAGILKLYTDLVQLRRNLRGTTRGLLGANFEVFHVDDAAKVIGYRRWDKGGPGDDVIVIANFSGDPISTYKIGLPRAGVWHVRFHSDSKKYASDYPGTDAGDVVAVAASVDGLGNYGTVELGSYEVLFLSQ